MRKSKRMERDIERLASKVAGLESTVRGMRYGPWSFATEHQVTRLEDFLTRLVQGHEHPTYVDEGLGRVVSQLRADFLAHHNDIVVQDPEGGTTMVEQLAVIRGRDADGRIIAPIRLANSDETVFTFVNEDVAYSSKELAE